MSFSNLAGRAPRSALLLALIPALLTSPALANNYGESLAWQFTATASAALPLNIGATAIGNTAPNAITGVTARQGMALASRQINHGPVSAGVVGQQITAASLSATSLALTGNQLSATGNQATSRVTLAP